jgi:hypothetical protein
VIVKIVQNVPNVRNGSHGRWNRAHDETMERLELKKESKTGGIHFPYCQSNQTRRYSFMRTLDLLASDSSHLPFLYVFKESNVMEKYGRNRSPHRRRRQGAYYGATPRCLLAGEIDF